MATFQASINVSKSKFSTQVNDTFKRAADVVISAVVLIILAPLFGLIAWAIKRESPGPAFYCGPRIGRGGRPFNILKFRTMYERSESYQGPKVTAQDDPRVTHLGHWLRETKLNELPQFWNVLKGEMSLVGPRPEDPSIAENWPREISEEVLSVRPGITSPASVEYRNEESLLSASSWMHKYIQELSPDKLRLDQLYVRYRSFWLDLDTLLWTALVMLPRIRSYTPPEQLLFVGPITHLFRRYITWFTIDLLVTFVSIGFTGFVWRITAPLNVGWPRAIAGAIGFALMFSFVGSLMRVNRISWSQASNADVFDLFPAWFIATLIGFLANIFLGIFPSNLILEASLVAMIGFVVVRYRSRLFTGFLSRLMRDTEAVQATRERVLIVGSGPTAQLAAWLFQNPGSTRKFRIVGFVNNDLFKQGTRIFGAEVLGTCREIPRLIKELDVGVLVMTDHFHSVNEQRPIFESCNGASIKLLVLPDFLAAFNGLLEHPTSHLLKSDVVEEPDDLVCQHCLTRLTLLNSSKALEKMDDESDSGELPLVH